MPFCNLYRTDPHSRDRTSATHRMTFRRMSDSNRDTVHVVRVEEQAELENGGHDFLDAPPQLGQD